MLDDTLARAAERGDAFTVLRVIAETPIEYKADALAAALDWAISGGQESLVKELIKHGADVNRPGARGHLLLCAAAKNGHLAITRQLLSAGADRSLADKWGKRPIDYARDYRHAAVVQALALPTDLRRPDDIVALA